MELNKIEDSEMLYRVVRRSDPDGFIHGRPTAALFMDEKGVSVDRDGERCEQEIIETFKKRFGKREIVVSLFKAIQLAQLCEEVHG